MLHPDPMGSPFADAAVSLLRKLTFKGKWTLAFCNIQIPPVHYHNIKFILFFPPPGLNVCSHDRPSEPWYKCEEHRKSPMITRCPLGWAGDSLHSLWNGNISRHLISAHSPLSSQIMCHAHPEAAHFMSERPEYRETGKQMIGDNIMHISQRSSEAFRNGNIRHKICLNKSPAHFTPKTLLLQLSALRKSEVRPPSGHEHRSSFHFASSGEVCKPTDCHWPVRKLIFHHRERENNNQQSGL